MMRPFNVKKGEVPWEISTFSSIFPWEDKIGKKKSSFLCPIFVRVFIFLMGKKWKNAPMEYLVFIYALKHI